MKVYNDKGEEHILGEGDKCPQTGRYLIPRGFLTIPPPPPIAGKIRLWNGVAWVYDVVQLPAVTRAQRNAVLRETDWTQLADAPANTKKRYKAYRQALRDLPEVEGWPFVNFPVLPE